MTPLLLAAAIAASSPSEIYTPQYHEFARCYQSLDSNDNDGFFWCYAKYLDELQDMNEERDNEAR